METKYFSGGCTNSVPMEVSNNLLVSVSIPILVNTDASCAASGRIEDEEVRDEFTGALFDGRIVREIKPCRATGEEIELTSFQYRVPKSDEKLLEISKSSASSKKRKQSMEEEEPKCNCAACNVDSSNPYHTQSQHRYVQCFAAYHGVDMECVEGIDPAQIQKEHAYFTEEM